MFRGRGILLIVTSLVVALVAAVVANRWFEARAAADANAGVRTQQVVVAALDIPFGTKVEDRHLALAAMVDGTAPRAAFGRKEDVVGKVSRASLLAGEILLQERFADQGAGSTLAAVVEKHMRAITVRVDDVVGVGGFLLPGNRVDVLASKDKLGVRDVETRTILYNVKVLAVDQTASTDKNEPVVVRAVTLEVSPDDAEILTKGMREGSIQLTLRNPLDDAAAPKPKKAEPAPRVARERAPAPAPITVIRGTQVGNTSN